MVKEIIIRHAVMALLNAIPPELLVKGADRLLDIIEEMIAKSENQVDDAVVVPIIAVIRTSFHIPDEDGAQEIVAPAIQDNISFAPPRMFEG